MKRAYNEMVKLWGSAAEGILYGVRGLRSFLLFDIPGDE
jgi:hypothetical protein